MSRREAWISAAAIFLVALAIRVVAASTVVFPKPEDTAYYVGVARNLVEGHGLVSDALWSYQTPPLRFPRPAFEVWLPLPTLLAALPMAVLGATFRASQLVPVLAGSIVAVLAWRLAADVAAERSLPPGRARTLALGAGLTAAAYLPLVLHSTLLDSTIPFTALALGACLLMSRIVGDVRGARRRDPRLIGLGLLIGLAALTRNEAAWLALAWVLIAWRAAGATRGERVRLIGVVGVVAFAIFAPWAYRDWVVFGNPLPGQALANALSVTGTDIFAWNDPPTVSRYLAVGPARLVEMRLGGITHNLFNVLVYLGIPISIIGLLALPWTGRARALRPVLVVSLLTFAVTSLAFPVATTWGTFLHAAGPAHVLIIVSSVLALDGAIAAVGRRRGWSRPVAWLGPALTIFAAVMFTAAILPTFGSGSEGTRRQYEALGRQLTAAGLPPERMGPVITNFPIWWAEAYRGQGLALPDERPADVLDLANHFGARYLVLFGDGHGAGPSALAAGGPGADCFTELQLPEPADPADATAVADTHVYRVGCG